MPDAPAFGPIHNNISLPVGVGRLCLFRGRSAGFFRPCRYALGYLSEVERGQKEASSEILSAVADALETPLSVIMGEVSDRLAIVEGLSGPMTCHA